MKDYEQIDGLFKQLSESLNKAYDKGYKQGVKDKAQDVAEDKAVKGIRAIIDEVTEDICIHYCKYPDTWDEETQGDLFDSEICQNCPLNRL